MKNSTHKLLINRVGFITGILFILISCQNSVEKKLQLEIDQIAARFVPDKRIGICNVKAKSGVKGTIILTGETTSLQAKQDITKTLYNKGISLIDSIIILPDSTKNRNYLGLVTLSVINLRKEPAHSSELVSQAILGTPLLILKNTGSWLLVQTPDNYISWTEESSVRTMTRTEMTAWKKSTRVIYCENTGWLYDSTSVSSGVVGDLVGGSLLEKTGELNGFISVDLPDGRKGFAEKQKLTDFDTWKNTVSGNEESICKVAVTYMGLPYLWGGSSTKGVDCSGFVQSVYFRNGVILARDASLQALHGLKIDISDGYSRLKKGDLLFFGSKENGMSHVTHVAIYLGKNEYINSSGRVMINSLDSTQVNYSSYRQNSLLTTKRIIGVEGDPGIVPVNKHPWY